MSYSTPCSAPKKQTSIFSFFDKNQEVDKKPTPIDATASTQLSEVTLTANNVASIPLVNEVWYVCLNYMNDIA